MAEIPCIDEEILCDSVQYYCDGSVRVDDHDSHNTDAALSITPMDYTEFKETDVGSNRLSVDSATQLTITNLDNDEDVRLVKDWGEGNEVTGNFTRQFSYQMSGGADYDIVIAWGISNTASDRLLQNNDKDTYFRMLYLTALGGAYGTLSAGNGSADSSTLLTWTTRYYVKVERVGMTTYAYIYSDSSFSTLVDTLQVDGTTALDYRYEFGMSAFNWPGKTGAVGTGVVYDLSIVTSTPITGESATTYYDREY